MSYNVDVIRCNLIRTNMSTNIDKLDKTFLEWMDEGDNEVILSESYFEWDDDFINDLIRLARFGVRGGIVIMGEEGEYTKFVLVDKQTVEEYDGKIVFEKEPHEIHSKIK